MLMGHETWEELLSRFVEVRDAQYHNDNEMAAARIESMESTLQAMLEKLRDGDRK